MRACCRSVSYRPGRRLVAAGFAHRRRRVGLRLDPSRGDTLRRRIGNQRRRRDHPRRGDRARQGTARSRRARARPRPRRQIRPGPRSRHDAAAGPCGGGGLAAAQPSTSLGSIEITSPLSTKRSGLIGSASGSAIRVTGVGESSIAARLSLAEQSSRAAANRAELGVAQLARRSRRSARHAAAPPAARRRAPRAGGAPAPAPARGAPPSSRRHRRRSGSGR